MQTFRHEFSLEGTPVVFDSGTFAYQAHGAALVHYGDNALLTTAQLGSARVDADFFPLVVDYQPKFYAAGKIKNSRFLKREARPSDGAILVCRLIDRPIRPMFPKGITNEVQIIANLFQADTERSPAAMAITSASLACLLGGLPIEEAISAVRVGIKEDGSFYLNPTYEEIDNGDLDLIVAGTADAITMVEAGANLISNEQMLAALEYAHKSIKILCQEQSNFVTKIQPESLEYTIGTVGKEETKAIEEFLQDSDFDDISGVTKKEIKAKMKVIEEKVVENFVKQIEDGEFQEGRLKRAVEKKFAKNMRKRVFITGKRADGRVADEIRPLNSKVNVFSKLHGTGVFQRGETQVLSVLTLGSPRSAQTIDEAERDEYESRYFHHYNFPPYSVGEVAMLRGTNRREVGHGALAERALRYVLPPQDKDFMYTMRVVSEVLSCNGSSSMASVCGSTLALMDGGVPIRRPIAGIAMGLFMDDESGDYKILTDIQGLEDFDGDMDFKVAGDEKGITALQLDIKIKGLKLSLLEEAMEKAKKAREKILESMLQAIKEPRKELSEYAPRIFSTQIKQDEIAMVIGKGGENVKRLAEEYDCEVDVQEDGMINITGTNHAQCQEAIKDIERMFYEPEIGEIFEAEVKSIKDFGAFVEYLPKKEALVHVSEIAKERVDKVEDYLKMGQKVTVKYLGADREGRVKLSMKQV